jgi:HSP20 family molecular chaperone IbpA
MKKIIISGIVAAFVGFAAGVWCYGGDKTEKKDDSAVKVSTATNGNELVKTITINLGNSASNATGTVSRAKVSDPFDDISKMIDEQMSMMNEEIERSMLDMDSMFDNMRRMRLNMLDRMKSPSAFRDGQNIMVQSAEISDVEDKGGNYEVTVSGIDDADSKAEVNVDGRQLNIKYQGSTSKESGTGNSKVKTYASSSISQSVTLPGPVKADKVTTEKKDGKLIIRIPKE